MVALQVKRIPGGAVLMFLIELAFGNLFDNFLRRGRSSVIVGVLLFDPCVWPVLHARSGSAGISNHKEFVFLGSTGFPWAYGRLIDADPTFLYNYVGEVPVVASLSSRCSFPHCTRGCKWQ